MHDPHTDRRTPIYNTWCDPEFIFYGIFGIVVIGLGARALAHWAMSEWAAGSRVLPGVALVGIVVASAALLSALRSHKRWLYLGTAFATIALATFILGTAGLLLPPGWLH